MTEKLTLSALARKLGRAKSGLHALEQRGQISREPDGLFRLDRVMKDLKANVEPGRAKPVHVAEQANAVNERSNGWPRPVMFTDVEITPDTARQLGRLIGHGDGTPLSDVGETLILIGTEIVMAEVARIKQAAGEK